MFKKLFRHKVTRSDFLDAYNQANPFFVDALEKGRYFGSSRCKRRQSDYDELVDAVEKAKKAADSFLKMYDSYIADNPDAYPHLNRVKPETQNMIRKLESALVTFKDTIHND